MYYNTRQNQNFKPLRLSFTTFPLTSSSSFSSFALPGLGATVRGQLGNASGRLLPVVLGNPVGLTAFPAPPAAAAAAAAAADPGGSGPGERNCRPRLL